MLARLLGYRQPQWLGSSATAGPEAGEQVDAGEGGATGGDEAGGGLEQLWDRFWGSVWVGCSLDGGICQREVSAHKRHRHPALHRSAHRP